MMRLNKLAWNTEKAYIGKLCDSKGKKDRRVPLPEAAAPALRRQLESRKVLHERDLDEGAASVYLPRAIDRKYPNAHKELRWQ
ncbi:MAG: hypothetical protein F9B45_11690 [Phycisphaera sp. RhM]|nr:hypothetical protein [Phycisphaera sp. RhM]